MSILSNDEETKMDTTAIETPFLNELNADSNLSFASNHSADAGDNSQESSCSTPAQPLKKKYARKKGELDFLGIVTSNSSNPTEGDPPSDTFSAETLFEYQWPPEKGGEHWMLQEQVTEFLAVSSFKRKHPEILRRNVEMLERDFLREHSVVTEMQCDLGLTALKASEVMDLMAVDYVDKYEEYVKVLQEREKQLMKNQRLQYQIPQVDKSEMVKFVKKAMNSCAEFNSTFLRERKEERTAYFDMQTMNIHYPKSKFKVLPAEMTNPGLYPIALIPGQYQNYFKKFTSEELKYLPLSSVMHHPPRNLPSKWQDPSLIEKYSDDEDEQLASDDEDSGSGSDLELEESKFGGKKSLKRKFEEAVKHEPPSKERCHKCRKLALGFGPLPDGQKHSKKVAGMRELIRCTDCKKLAHPWCWELTIIMAKVIKGYEWQCMECKTCLACNDPHDEEKMMFCDLCDRGYHSYCVGLHDIPLGKWECPRCNDPQTEANSPSDDESHVLSGRPLTGRGSRGSRRARGARSTRGEGRGRGGTSRGTPRGTPTTRGTPRAMARGTPRGTPRATPRGIPRGVATPRGRGTRGLRGSSTPRTRGRGRGRGRGRPSSSSPSDLPAADVEDVRAAIDAVVGGMSDEDGDASSGISGESAEELRSAFAAADVKVTAQVPMSLVKISNKASKEEEASGIPMASFDDELDEELEEAQEES